MATTNKTITTASGRAEHPSEHWSARLAFVLAAAGSAVGLGNVWKFPYIAGEHGGGACVMVYLRTWNNAMSLSVRGRWWRLGLLRGYWRFGSALAFNLWSRLTVFDKNFFGFLDYLTANIMFVNISHFLSGTFHSLSPASLHNDKDAEVRH